MANEKVQDTNETAPDASSLAADIVKTALWVFIYHAARELQQQLQGDTRA